MEPLPASSYMSYCSGVGTFFNTKKYDKDLAFQRSQSRLFQAWIDSRMKAEAVKSLQPALQGQQINQPNMAFFIHRGVQLLFAPIQQLLSLIQEDNPNTPKPLLLLARMGQQAPEILEEVLSNIASFFLGFKKDKSKEKELRDENDYANMLGMDDILTLQAGDVIENAENQASTQ